MLWSKPLLYYLIGNSSYTIGRHSFLPDQLERSTELSINLPHFLVDGQPRWKRNAERTTTLSVDEFAKSVTGHIATMTPLERQLGALEVHAQWFGRAQKVETELKRDLDQRTKSLALVAPLYVRGYIERTTARLIAGRCFDPNILRKALSVDVKDEHSEVSTALKKEQEKINQLRAEFEAGTGRNRSVIAEEVELILDDIQKEATLSNAVQLAELLKPAMKDELRIKVSSYYTFWLFILQGETLSEDPEVIALKTLMKENGVYNYVLMAREIASLWVYTSTLGVHIPPESGDITLSVILIGLELHKMLHAYTSGVVTTLFNFMTGKGKLPTSTTSIN